MLPHLLFGDLTRFVLDAHARGDDDLVRRALAFLNKAFREGDDIVQNLVGMSFVENVGPGITSRLRSSRRGSTRFGWKRKPSVTGGPHSELRCSARRYLAGRSAERMTMGCRPGDMGRSAHA